MVLEHLFSSKWLEKKFLSAMSLGVLYSIIGISISHLLFGGNTGIASVMFTSILLTPSLKKIFKKEEKMEEGEKTFSLKHFYRDNDHLIKTYLGVFLGVFIAYYIISFLGASTNMNIAKLLREQLEMGGISGHASFDSGLFWEILNNNWWILLACFVLSLISGDGATFFVVWNASSWAAIFGFRAVAIASNLGTSSILTAMKLQLIVGPHTIIEGLAYILAGIAGAMISYDVISEAKELSLFIVSFLGLGSLFLFLRFFLKLITFGPFLLILEITILLTLLWLLSKTFIDKKHRKVFIYNYYLFVLAIVIFIIGALIETAVLSWSDTLIYLYSAL